MKNTELFETKLDEATEIRKHIQDDLRKEYNEYKLLFKSFTGEEGKVLKHVVDQYHYREGGYPNESSPPKHQELVEKFAQMVLYFDLIGFSKLYKEELDKWGITVKVNQGSEIQNVPVVEEALEVIETTSLKRLIKSKKPMYKEVIKAFVLHCDGLQGEICANSNEIKREIAPAVELACEVKKAHFTGSVMVNYHKEAGKITKKKVETMERNLKGKIEIGEFDIENAKEDLD